jgi:hypothetical protein
MCVVSEHLVGATVERVASPLIPLLSSPLLHLHSLFCAPQLFASLSHPILAYPPITLPPPSIPNLALAHLELAQLCLRGAKVRTTLHSLIRRSHTHSENVVRKLSRDRWVIGTHKRENEV